jgi:hypothetical protein
LRSTKEVIGYSLRAIDGFVGRVEDFIVETGSDWFIRYMVVETDPLLSDKNVLISPGWIEKISWEDKSVDLNLLKKVIVNSPEYHPRAAVNRDYEDQLYDYYGRPKYWE